MFSQQPPKINSSTVNFAALGVAAGSGREVDLAFTRVIRALPWKDKRPHVETMPMRASRQRTHRHTHLFRINASKKAQRDLTRIYRKEVKE
jgi:hypothetical protein